MLDTLINFEVHCYRDNVTINCQLNVTKLGRWLLRLVSIIVCLIVITFGSIIDPVLLVSFWHHPHSVAVWCSMNNIKCLLKVFKL